ncbi:peptidoglycan DD-metalloendopeptidase family protein [Shewanella sp. SR44-3]|uniref:peptidoglycan DD-metalloendopeptidase family protein n=1 Tax=Shewanella sp. SR44-3 TaxID=2760936 RepID=UPI0015F8CA6D|nr:peptidoglycan DD-metalloendopeptidase family protein [Shewanella sp. SR44-3]MBB1269167.1 peptidoglycan DD-metalloendopeptidase family protein [Shewanella sp. SR44-3]
MTSFWPTLLCIILFASGCSFQAQRPAPVESLSSVKGQKHYKGSIKSQQYRVKKGDTLYSISWGAGKNFMQVARLNHLTQPYTIYPGQIIKLSSENYPNTSSPTRAQPYKAQGRGVVSGGISQPYQVVNTPSKTLVGQTANSVLARENKSVNTTKKELDPKLKSAYSVTSAKQTVNLITKEQANHLPAQVSQWYWPVLGKLIGTFSETEQGNQGIKIAGRRGDLIKAAADGKVVYAGDALRGYGNLVIIKHNDDFLSAYAHAETILVKEKQLVAAGQAVAKMGDSGANQVMLHFEIRYHGKSVNPLKYLPKQ